MRRTSGGFGDKRQGAANDDECVQTAALRAAATIGRPLGSASFRDAIAARTGRDARLEKRGRKKRIVGD
jgi:hypothetical protein